MAGNQDTVKIDALIDLLIDKGVIERWEFTDALYKKLGIPVLGAKGGAKTEPKDKK